MFAHKPAFDQKFQLMLLIKQRKSFSNKILLHFYSTDDTFLILNVVFSFLLHQQCHMTSEHDTHNGQIDIHNQDDKLTIYFSFSVLSSWEKCDHITVMLLNTFTREEETEIDFRKIFVYNAFSRHVFFLTCFV